MDRSTMYVFEGLISDMTCFVSKVILDNSASISTRFHLRSKILVYERARNKIEEFSNVKKSNKFNQI